MPQMHIDEAIIHHLMTHFGLPTLVIFSLVVLLSVALKMRRWA